jgi:hypothetical protein
MKRLKLIRGLKVDKNTKQSDRPDYANAAHTSMSKAWTIVKDVSGGTARMREAATTYLPQEPAEKSPAYNRRLNRSVFFNAYDRTRDALVGMVFKNDPKVGDDVPGEIQNHLENIDLAGSHVDVFTKELFKDAFEGHAFILVDMQPALPPGSTRADEIQAKRRPYWVKYKACQALNWRTSVINGETVLSQITFEEKTNEASGEYGEQTVCRYRVFRLVGGVVSWTVYRKAVGNSPQDEIVQEATGTMSDFNKIPVAVVYGNRLAMLESSPPLEDLAHLNIRHYQNYSDYAHILHVAQVPILVRTGINTEDESIEVSVGRTIDVPNPEGRVYWAEIQGPGIEAGRRELQDQEQRMALMGLSMLSQKTDSNVTATEIRSNNLQESSDLSTMARSLQDAIEMALEFHAKYLGMKSGGSVKLGVADSDLMLDAPMVLALSNAVDKGQLTLETWINILQRGFPGVELADELKKLEAEAIKNAQNGPVIARSAIAGAPPAIRDLFGAATKGNGASA